MFLGDAGAYGDGAGAPDTEIAIIEEVVPDDHVSDSGLLEPKA